MPSLSVILVLIASIVSDASQSKVIVFPVSVLCVKKSVSGTIWTNKFKGTVEILLYEYLHSALCNYILELFYIFQGIIKGRSELPPASSKQLNSVLILQPH